MGIQGLIPFLKKSARFANLKEFKGQCAAIDAYCWLHKGAFSCADKLVKGEPTDGYIIYVMRQVDLLLSFDIKPILVFDGCHLPSKAITETKRRENRERNRRKAKELLREGNIKEAREYFQRCVDVTSEMAHRVIQACRARNIDVIVAPYEADAELAYLDKTTIADLIITEDSDLVLFGCKKIIFKLDSNGGGMLIEKEKLHLSMGLARDKFFFEKFRNMCILSGCDYLPSLHGIGLAKAKRFITVTSNPDIFNAISRLPSYLNMPSLEVPDAYRHGFMRAINTIEHQLVFDPISRTLQPLSPYPMGASQLDFPYCGQSLEDEMAYQLALGNVNVQTKQVIDNYEPDSKPPTQKHQPKSSNWAKKASSSSHHLSIWSRDFHPLRKSGTNDQPQMGVCKEETKTCTVTLPPSLLKKRKIELESDITSDQLESIYGSQKKPKKEPDDNPIDESCVNSNGDENESIEQKTLGETDILPSSTSLEDSEQKQRNPFAIKCPGSDPRVAPPQSRTSCFSALKNFSSKERTIVRSRYFKSTPSPQKSTTPIRTNPKNENIPLEDISNLSSNDKISFESHNNEEASNSSKDALTPDSFEDSKYTLTPDSSSTKSILNKDSRSPLLSSSKAFRWKKISEMFSYEKSSSSGHSSSLATSGACIPSSPASRGVFLPPKVETLPDTPPDSQDNGGKLCPEGVSESKIEDGVAENIPMEGEDEEASSCMPPTVRNPFAVKKKCDTESTSLQLSNSSEIANVMSSLETTKENIFANSGASSSLQKSYASKNVPVKSTCRTPGLARVTGKRQLSLKEMFAFKKNVSNVASS